MKDKRIGVLMGGRHTEHEVSMRTGKALAGALRSRGYNVAEVLVDTDLPARLIEEGVEIAFIALHGRWGEDGCVQGMLEVMRIPYTGSGVLASALSMDKIFSKQLFRQHGLPVAPDLVVKNSDALDFNLKRLPFGFPVVIKPANEGSSVGVSIVRAADSLQPALNTAAGFPGNILIEQYIPGREIQVAVLEDRALGTIEVVSAGEFYDYQAKYHSGGSTRYIVPAKLEGDLTDRALELGLRAHQVLGCRGVSRVDMILDRDGAYRLLEVNAVPGMTESSLVPKIAATVGISFEDLAERILLGAGLKV